MAFHEVSLPHPIALNSLGGPERRTIIVEGRPGSEARNSVWADSKRRYDIGVAARSLNDLYQIIEFFEERRGRLHGFRFKDGRDWKSRGPQSSTAFGDQIIGTGTGALTTFQLVKTYGSLNPWTRTIKKPVAGTVKIGLNGIAQSTGWSVVTSTGVVTFTVPPPAGVVVTAGFEFDVPVRFDIDRLEINLRDFSAGIIPVIPIVEDPNA